MTIGSHLEDIWHGADYNPEQWPDEVRRTDAGLMREARLSVATVGIFSWSAIQPEAGVFEWGWLDDTFTRLSEQGIGVILATPSASHPRWLSAAHPEVDACDGDGRRRRPGGRQHFCPSSTAFRDHVAGIDGALAQRYGRHPALKLWHIGNESMSGCWCDACVRAWRGWLARRYGSLDELNRQWWTAFWSQRFSTWEEVIPPYAHAGGSTGQWLDWRRFQSHQLCELYRFEVACIRPSSPDVPATTNGMGFYPWVDLAKFGDAVDVVSWDSYPAVGGDPSLTAMSHALTRGLKPRTPWLLMEQTPSATNWQDFATLKPPGLLRLESWQAVAHGANSAMYFQFRRSRGANEKFHGAIVEHSGSSDTRVFREVSAFGAELAEHGAAIAPTLASAARVGIVHDWENRWALDGSGRDKTYVETLQRHFRSLWRQNIAVDVVRLESDWTPYRILIMPMLYMVKTGRFPREGSAEELAARVDVAAKLSGWVSAGGTAIATCLSGIADESDLVFENGYPGPLRDLFGVWVEETDHRRGSEGNVMEMEDASLLPSSRYACGKHLDLMRPEGAGVVARYGGDWYRGGPCVTANAVGSGRAVWLGTDAEDAFLADFYRRTCADLGIVPVVAPADGVEVVERIGVDRRFLFLLNHAHAERTIALGGITGTDLITGRACAQSIALEPLGVAVISTSMVQE